MPMEVPITRRVDPGDGRFDEVVAVLRKAIEDRVFPGAVAAVGSASGTSWLCGAGTLFHGTGPAATPDTIYDLASLTKVVATTSVVERLWEGRKLSLEDQVRRYVPAFAGGGRDEVTVEHLLTHSSGLPSWRPLFREARTRDEAIAMAAATPLERPPGTAERYSDIGAILLGECAARAGGAPIAALTWRLVLDPLAMRDTGFRPPPADLPRIAPTEEDREYRSRLIHGEVHDENASALDGVAGHAGLFSTAADLARFAREVLRAVRGEGPEVFSTEGMRLFAARRGKVPGSSRALGWDTRADEEDGTGPKGSKSSSGRLFSPGSFGHTGFTGTSIWFDPSRNLFAVLLTNHVHPTRKTTGMSEARRSFHDAAVRASA
jgi:CubicO group peptidase (beta-lactamase class C family)